MCVCVCVSVLFSLLVWYLLFDWFFVTEYYRHSSTSAGAEAVFINYDDIMRVSASQPLSAAFERKFSDIEPDGGATVCVSDCTWSTSYRSWK